METKNTRSRDDKISPDTNASALTDAELEDVSGGFNPQPEPPASMSNIGNRVNPLTSRLGTMGRRRF